MWPVVAKYLYYALQSKHKFSSWVEQLDNLKIHPSKIMMCIYWDWW